MGVVKKIKGKLMANPIIGRIFGEYSLKTLLFAFISFLINLAFAIFNLVLAITRASIWHSALAGYYFALLIFRGIILPLDIHNRQKYEASSPEYRKKAIRLYAISGIFLLVIDLIMCGAVSEMVMHDRHSEYGEIMAIATAAYAFYKISMAIYNFLKSRKSGEPVTIALRNLNFAEALMSMASLTVLLLSTFGKEGGSENDVFIKAIVSLAACAFVLFLSIFTIIDAHKRSKQAALIPHRREEE